MNTPIFLQMLRILQKNEIVKPLPAPFEDYFITSYGRVLSTKRDVVKERVLKMKKKNGYLALNMSADGHVEEMLVHQVVCEAFNGPRKPGQQVRHLDGDRLNNQASNLVWGSAADNCRDRELHGRTARGTRHGNAVLTEREVRNIRMLAESRYFTYTYIAQQFGVAPGTVSNVARGLSYREVQ
jgi:hypothetical protein